MAETALRHRSAPPPRTNAAGREATTRAGADTLALAESLPYLLRDTHRQFVRILQHGLAAYGISTGQWYLLRVLWEQEGLTQAELSARIGIMTPTTVSTLDGLARRGLVVRRPHPSDKRKHRVFLTAKGRQLEKELIPIAQRAHDDALSGISERSLSDVRRVLRTIKANIARMTVDTTGEA